MRIACFMALLSLGCGADDLVASSDEFEFTHNCLEASSCRQSRFDPALGTCVEELLPDGTTCIAPCMESATCAAGVCTGTPRGCDDGNICTTDVCTMDRCKNEPDPVQACGASSDPCLVPVCDGACGLAAAPDGSRCGPATCSMRHVCEAGICREEAVAEGAPCEGACGSGHCLQGICSGDDELHLAWQIETWHQPRFDPESGAVIFHHDGWLHRKDRDGSVAALADVDGLPWSAGGIGGSQVLLPDPQASTAAGIPIDGKGQRWSIEVSGHIVRDQVVLADGRTVLGLHGGDVMVLDPQGRALVTVSLCKGGDIALAADERERIFAAVVCYDDATELRVMELAPGGARLRDMRLFVLQGRWISSLNLVAAMDGHVLLSGHEEGRTRAFIVDMSRSQAIELDDRPYTVAMTKGLLFVSELNVIRALDLHTAEERWVFDAADLPGACSTADCGAGWWYSSPVLSTDRGTLLLAGSFGVPALLEVTIGGTVLRRCSIPHVDHFAEATLMDGRLVAWIGSTRYAAWDLPGRPGLAAGWFGREGAPAGGQRAHAP